MGMARIVVIFMYIPGMISRDPIAIDRNNIMTSATNLMIFDKERNCNIVTLEPLYTIEAHSIEAIYRIAIIIGFNKFVCCCAAIAPIHKANIEIKTKKNFF